MLVLSRRQWLTGAGSLLIASLARPQTSEDARLNEFLEAVFQRDLNRSPIRQSRLGIKQNQDEWDDISERHQLEDGELYRNDLKRLAEFNVARLSTQARISWRMFDWVVSDNLQQVHWRRNDYLLTQMSGLHTRVPATLVNDHSIGDLADAEAYVTRLKGIEPLMRQLVVELERQEHAGVLPPRFVYALIIDPCLNLLKGRPFTEGADDCTLLADFRTKVGKAALDDTQRTRLLSAAESALREQVGRGYQHLIDHLRSGAKAATDLDGVWKLPQGAAYYRWQLLSATTLPASAAELHALGVRQVERIHGEMTALAVSSGFRGSLQDWFAHVREDPQNYYPDSAAGRQQYLTDAHTLLQEVCRREDEFLGLKPRASVVVRAVEEWRQKSAPKAFYHGPPADGSAPGIFYINLYDLHAAPKYQLPAILYHEAVPGHHIETVIAHELTDVPRFRRFASIAAFSEGWGLYSERLAAELGLYRDAYTDFGRLSLELMRACRLVVDTGIHALRWSREQAVRYLDQNMPGSHHDNQREVDRYIVLPGQATSYYVGMMKILALRDKAKQQLRGKFDVRAFHDAVLQNGPLPLPILEGVIDAWISSQRA